MGESGGIGSSILDKGRTPEQWCDALAKRHIEISERHLRQKARQLGACYQIGRAMIITPDQMDIIIEDGRCRSNHISAAQSGGQKAGSKSTGARSRTTSAKALDHLQKAARGTGSLSSLILIEIPLDHLRIARLHERQAQQHPRLLRVESERCDKAVLVIVDLDVPPDIPRGDP